MFKKTLFALLIIFISQKTLTAQDYSSITYNTNIEGLVLKNLRCSRSSMMLNIVNRTSQSVSGTLMLTVFDKDTDPIDNGRQTFSLGPVSGERTFISVSCNNIHSVAFRIE